MDINTGGIADSFANFVWEPAVVKVSFNFQSFAVSVCTHLYMCNVFADIFTLVGYLSRRKKLHLLGTMVAALLQINAINAATEAACLVLSVDETVKNPKVM